MSYFLEANSTACPNTAQNTRPHNLKKLPNVKSPTHKTTAFITLRTKIPTQHVLHTTKDLDKKGLKAGGSGAPRSTNRGETHDGQKTQPVHGADSMLRNPPLHSSRSTTIQRPAQNHIV